MTRRLRASRYRHYLGSWDPADRLRVSPRTLDAEPFDWHSAEDSDLVALGARETLGEGDGAAFAGSEDAMVAALTVPAKVRKALWELGWDEAAATMTPSDQAAFEAYGRRVVAFFRAAGVPFGGDAHPCNTRLVAATPGVNATVDSAAPGVVALVNVGESELFVVATGTLGDSTAAAVAVSLRVPPDEGCLLSSGARPYVVIVPDDAEFGLLLELAAR